MPLAGGRAQIPGPQIGLQGGVGVDECLEELLQIHQIVYRHLGDEVLWCASMPCELPPDDEIDLSELTDAPPESVKTPIDRLAEAFPGSELVNED